MTTPARACYAGYRFPAEIISHAVWLYFRFPLGLRMVEELLAARAGVGEPRRSSLEFAPENQVRTGLPAGGREIRTLGPSRKGKTGKVERGRLGTDNHRSIRGA